jgi:arsenite methyltransferase
MLRRWAIESPTALGTPWAFDTLKPTSSSGLPRRQAWLNPMDTTRAEQLRTSVRQVYSTIAATPRSHHPFAIGRPLAKNVGYPSHQLDELPPAAVASFAGVSAVSCFAKLAHAANVLDLGCGAGLDSLLAAQRIGTSGQVIGVDFSPAMLALARQNAALLKLANVHFLNADAEQLPLATGAIDTALVNGIFNLNPARTAIFAELARVVRPSGTVYVAEIVLRQALPAATIASETEWFA